MSEDKPRLPNPTNEQLEERISFVYEELLSGTRTGSIKKHFRQKFGEADHCTILRYIGRAKEILFSEMANGKNEARVMKSAFYQRIYGDTMVPLKDRLRASELDDKILGLQQSNVSLTDKDGTILDVTDVGKRYTEEERQAILKADAIYDRELPPPVDQAGSAEDSSVRSDAESSRNGDTHEPGEVPEPPPHPAD